MEEQASFEPRSVLGRRRAGWNSLAIVVPALALVATVWAGTSGHGSDAGSGAIAGRSPDSVAAAPPSMTVIASPAALPPRPQRLRYPEHVVGLAVERLDEVQRRRVGRDEVVAVAGWYVNTEITDCPRIVVIRREGSLPEVRRDFDHLAFCDRSGVLYASPPDLVERAPRNNLEDNRSKNAGLPAVAVTLVVGVVVPQQLEMIGATATPVVVVGRFVALGEGCRVVPVCTPELVVDHVAWANGR